jgi:hypothetical protein
MEHTHAWISLLLKWDTLQDGSRVSNHARKTNILIGFLWISSVPPDKCRDSTLKYTETTSYPILFKSSFTFILLFDATIPTRWKTENQSIRHDADIFSQSWKQDTLEIQRCFVWMASKWNRWGRRKMNSDTLKIRLTYTTAGKTSVQGVPVLRDRCVPKNRHVYRNCENRTFFPMKLCSFCVNARV